MAAPPRPRRPPPPAPGTVFVHAVGDAVMMPPKEGRELLFGRNRPEVHLCVGEDDLTVSRKHGTLTYLLVVGPDWGQTPRHGDQTRPVRAWDLHPEERLAVVVLAQAYLRNEAGAQPVSWQRAAELMTELDPGRSWTEKRVEHRVRAVRLRLAACGVHGLIQPEVGGSGDVLKHNLIKELIATDSISSKDLALIDGDGAPDR